MKYILLFIISFNTWSSDCQHTDTKFKCVEYVDNYDGDTIQVDIKGVHNLLGKRINVRLKGVDAPEIRTKSKCEKNKGRNAKKLVKSLLRKAKRIDLINIERDKYFRILADIIIDGKMLSGYLVKNNLAYEYHGGKRPKIDWCKRLPASK